MRVQYPGNPPQSHRWAINPSALRVVHGHNVGDQVRIMGIMIMILMMMMKGQDIRGQG